MNLVPFLISSLSLTALVLTGQAQSSPKATTKTVGSQNKAAIERQTADHRAAAYKGPKVVESSKALGNKMLNNSKPAPGSVPVPPVKQ